MKIAGNERVAAGRAQIIWTPRKDAPADAILVPEFLMMLCKSVFCDDKRTKLISEFGRLPMNNKVTLVALAAVILLQACASAPPSADQMAASSQNFAVTPALEVLRGNVAYTGIGPIGQAIEASLRDGGLLPASNGDARFKLKAELRNLGQPTTGLSMTATASVQYVLAEQSTGRVIFDKLIETSFTAGVRDALLNGDRQKVAAEGAFRTNIAEAIWQLSRLNTTVLSAAEPAPNSTDKALVAASPAISVPALAKQESPMATTISASSNTATAATRTPPESTVAPLVNSATSAAAPDTRADEMKKTYAALMQQARAGKLSYLNAARRYKEKFVRLYPEQAENTVMNEYLAYMAVLGERVDKKKLSEVEAEYELARKENELAERMAAMRTKSDADATAAKRVADEQAATRKANEDAAAFRERQAQYEAQRQEADRAEAARQQAALAAAVQAQANEQRRANGVALFIEGMRLLTPPPPVRPTTCRWMGPTWVCS